MEIQVTFKDKTTNMRTTRRGIKIGQHLAVVPGWQIYRIKKGIPIIPTRFATIEDALKVAKWIDHVYKKYFILWELGDINIFALAKWSVPNGLVIHETLERLPDQATAKDVSRIYSTSKRHAKKWLGITLKKR